MFEHNHEYHDDGGYTPPMTVSDDHHRAYVEVTAAIHREEGSEMEQAYLMHLWERGRKHARRYYQERGLIP